MLDATVRLAAYPLRDDLPLRGEARSRTCGSVATVALAGDDAGRVTGVGCRVQACAVGQAAASVFVGAAEGRTLAEIACARDALADWLAGAGARPQWPGIDLLEPAIAYPGRHAAILLAWDAALAALASAPPVR